MDDLAVLISASLIYIHRYIYTISSLSRALYSSNTSPIVRGFSMS